MVIVTCDFMNAWFEYQEHEYIHETTSPKDYGKLGKYVIVQVVISSVILFDSGMQLLGIRNLIKKDPETKHVNTISFLITAFVMLLLFVANVYECFFSLFGNTYDKQPHEAS